MMIDAPVPQTTVENPRRIILLSIREESRRTPFTSIAQILIS